MTPTIRSVRDLLTNRQHHRLLRLSYPRDDAPASEFLVNRLHAVESLSRDFEFTVELLCDNAHFALKDMQGKLLNIELVNDQGGLRYFSGYVFSFCRKGSDGAVTIYEAKLGPWFKFLSLRKDNYLFHGKNLYDQTSSIFSDYGAYPDWDWRVRGDDPPFTNACQFDESDHNYLSRRWEAAGWHYWYEHSANGHKLIVGDNSIHAAPIDADPQIRFQKHGGSREADAIDRWSPVRQLAAAEVTLTKFDFKSPAATAFTQVSVDTLNQQGKVPAIEAYDYVGAYGFHRSDDGRALATLRMEEIEAAAKHIDAESNHRGILPGRWFRLTDHFLNALGTPHRPGIDEFLILSVEHSASNNYLQKDNHTPPYRNSFTCTRKNVRWRPGRNFNSQATQINSPQTAIVVGHAGHNGVYTDEYGRIRVQFHWDRVGTNDDSSSAWIRVASNWAGVELGAQSIPRVGSEVIVQWLGGCPDRPLVTGSVYNQHNMPPWQLATQHALMGLRSRELTLDGAKSIGNRSNHLILDDTPAKIQAQLKSDHQSSQLSLGYITRIDGTPGRKDYRGDGWELATNAWGALRAGKGMLITTEARSNAKSHIKDMDETLQRLAAASQQQQAQASAAEQHGAQETQDQQSAIANRLQAQQASIKGTPELETEHSFPELSEPHLVLASPAGIATTSAQSTHIASAQDTALTTGKSLSIAAGDSLFASIKKTFRLFVHQAGLKMIAAAGDIDVKALSDSINLLAKLNITHTANRITISAKEEVMINGGGSYVKLNGTGIEQGTAGAFVVHAGTKNFTGPKSIINTISYTAVKQAGPHAISVLAHSAEGTPLKHAKVRLIDPIKKTKLTEQTVAADGATALFNAPHNQPYHALMGYQGWSVAFNEIKESPDEYEQPFDPGVLEEDRHNEHL